MGMYTELHYNAELKANTPEKIIDTLRLMLDGPKPYSDLPEHPLFKTDRWRIMLQTGSAYFAAPTRSTLELLPYGEGEWILSIRCNLKNYGGEIEHFIDWIDPYVEAFEGDFLGFHRYEESEDPVIIRKGK